MTIPQLEYNIQISYLNFKIIQQVQYISSVRKSYVRNFIRPVTILVFTKTKRKQMILRLELVSTSFSEYSTGSENLKLLSD